MKVKFEFSLPCKSYPKLKPENDSRQIAIFIDFIPLRIRIIKYILKFDVMLFCLFLSTGFRLIPYQYFFLQLYLN